MATAVSSNGQPASTETPGLEIKRIELAAMAVPIIGTSPLIMHRFSEKAKRAMLDQQQGRKSPKQARNPQADYDAAFYRFAEGDERFGFPVIAFKAAMISASRFYGKDVKMTELRQFVFIKGDLGVDGQQLAEIHGDASMREDVVKIGIKQTDLRYRPAVMPWRTTLHVVYAKSAISQEAVLALIDAGGMGVGVGEWRPERNGDFGMFQVDPEVPVESIG